MSTSKRVVWVVEVDGVPTEFAFSREQAERIVYNAWRSSRGRVRVVRYAPSSKAERTRTGQHARAAKRRGMTRGGRA